MHKFFKKLITYACAAALTVSGISLSGVGNTALIAYAKIIYRPGIQISGDQINIGDNTTASFTVHVSEYDEITGESEVLDENSGHKFQYSWSVEGEDCFEIINSLNEKTIYIKAKDNAAEILGNRTSARAQVSCDITMDGAIHLSTGYSVTLNSDLATRIKEASISPEKASFDANHKSRTFKVNGLDDIDTGTFSWDFMFNSDKNIYSLTSNGNTATVTLKDDAATKWREYARNDETYYHGLLSCDYVDENGQKTFIPANIGLYYYPDQISYDPEVNITDDTNEPHLVSSLPINGGEQITLYPYYSDPSLASDITNAIYSWTLDDDAQKFLEIVGPSTASSVVIRAKEDAAIGSELTSSGCIRLSVDADQLTSTSNSELTLDYTRKFPAFELNDYTFYFNDEMNTHDCILSNPAIPTMNGFSIELEGEDADSIFTITKANATTTTISVKPNAAATAVNSLITRTDRPVTSLSMPS
ncbi:MAG: hypothetical protein K6G84_03040 [Lachnospiraceae bacterium]|nr:hypothetical protein [Lachnospiraceae bacterium]